MNEVLVWGAAGISGASVITVVTFWMNIGTRLTTAELRAASAERAAAAAHSNYDSLLRDTNQRHDKMAQYISDYRVAMATDIAIVKTLAETNTTSLTAAENRVAKALEEVRDQLGKFNDRIDGVLLKDKQ